MSRPVWTADHPFGAARLQRLWSEVDACAQPPGPGTVLAVVAAVDRPPDAWDRFSPGEEEALARLRRADDRAAYAMAHGLLRGAFARMTGGAAKSMTLAYEAGGRPVIAEHDHLTVSLSHARSVVAVAIGSHVRVGIDVELLTGEAPEAGTLELALTAGEQALVNAEESHQVRERCFLQFWTAKEAMLKAYGLGLPAGLQSLCLADGFDRPRIDLPLAKPLDKPLDLQIAGFEQNGAICALAVEAEVRRLAVATCPAP